MAEHVTSADASGPEAHGVSAEYAVRVGDHVEARASLRARLALAVEQLSLRSRRTSLYSRVVAVNATIVAGATLILALTPATVPYPVGLYEALVLIVGVLLVLAANALLLRVSFAGLANVVRRMEAVDLLRPRDRLPLVGGPETRAVVTGVNQMLDRLEQERRESSQRTLAALEGERRRIGQELHDEIGQRLTGMLLQLGNLVTDAPWELRERIAVVQEDVRSTLDQVGMLAWQLRPGILDDLGLVRALEALVESFAEHGRGRIRSALPSGSPPIAPESELAIYRIVQEALTNAFRHSGARQIDVEIAAERHQLSVSVRDDGSGLSAHDVDGAGLRGMRERALAIGGALEIESLPGAGTSVVLDVPLTARAP